MPTFDPIETSSQRTSDRVWEAYQSKYVTAGNYAVWAQGLLETNLKEIRDKLEQDDLTPALQDLIALVDAIPSYTPGNIIDFTAPATPNYQQLPDYSAPTMGQLVGVPDYTPATPRSLEEIPGYTAPDAISFLQIPSYSAPTLGSILGIPAPEAITIPDAPSSTISFSNTAFSDSLLTAMKAQVEGDLGTGGEAAMFQRHTARVTAERAIANTEITTQFSARGFDMPPGALLAKQTEMNNESSKRLTDVSADIMQARNQQAMTVGAQLVDMLGRLHDTKIARDFEAAKTSVQLAFEGFKSVVEKALAEANIQRTEIEATVAYNKGTIDVYLGELQGALEPIKAATAVNQSKSQSYIAEVDAQVSPIKAIAGANQAISQMYLGEVEAAIAPIKAAVDVNSNIVKAYLGEVEGKVEPMKAIAAANQASATAYSGAVQAASAAVQANALPEELKIKQTGLQLEEVKIKSSILSDTAKMAIEAAFRDTTTSVETLKAMALSNAQMIASSWNTVSASASLGFSGSNSYSTSENANQARTEDIAISRTLRG